MKNWNCGEGGYLAVIVVLIDIKIVTPDDIHLNLALNTKFYII